MLSYLFNLFSLLYAFYFRHFSVDLFSDELNLFCDVANLLPKLSYSKLYIFYINLEFSFHSFIWVPSTC